MARARDRRVPLPVRFRPRPALFRTPVGPWLFGFLALTFLTPEVVMAFYLVMGLSPAAERLNREPGARVYKAG